MSCKTWFSACAQAGIVAAIANHDERFLFDSCSSWAICGKSIDDCVVQGRPPNWRGPQSAPSSSATDAENILVSGRPKVGCSLKLTMNISSPKLL